MEKIEKLIFPQRKKMAKENKPAIQIPPNAVDRPVGCKLTR